MRKVVQYLLFLGIVVATMMSLGDVAHLLAFLVARAVGAIAAGQPVVPNPPLFLVLMLGQGFGVATFLLRLCPSRRVGSGVVLLCGLSLLAAPAQAWGGSLFHWASLVQGGVLLVSATVAGWPGAAQRAARPPGARA
ncbi:hypothetical protein BXP70_28930 [Hymenobacter crusticola]|uniref:Uncharacterized protein n=1 Tax=Hymenobacter crusticola TaxID=1770526 RepID=A0A243W784_9BACT|nr:hypothetical protein BXP70_28930 [Hymenobacter crusticola]